MVQRVINVDGMHVAQAKDDNAGQASAAGGDQFAKTQVVGQQNAGFFQGIDQNGGMR